MANVSISEITQEITSASELDGNELFLISDINNSTYTSKKCNLGNIKNYVGTTVNNQEKTVSPSTSSQNVTPDSGYTGLSKVTVNAISTQTKSATPSKSAQTISPDSGKYLSSVSVSAVTNSIDSNIQAGNIKKDVSILGVTGTYSGEGIQTETKTVKSTTASQTVTPTSGKYISSITVSPIVVEEKTATPSTSSQTITPSSGKDYLSKVTVNAISAGNPSAITPTSFPVTVSPASGKTYMTTATVNAPANLSAGNIKSGVSIAGVTGTFTGSKGLSYLGSGPDFYNSYTSLGAEYIGTYKTKSANTPYKVYRINGSYELYTSFGGQGGDMLDSTDSDDEVMIKISGSGSDTIYANYISKLDSSQYSRGCSMIYNASSSIGPHFVKITNGSNFLFFLRESSTTNTVNIVTIQ